VLPGGVELGGCFVEESLLQAEEASTMSEAAKIAARPDVCVKTDI
jgi:hypothetical protein